MQINTNFINIITSKLEKNLGRTEAEAVMVLTIMWGKNPREGLYKPSRLGAIYDLSVFPEETVDRYLDVLGW